MDKRTVLQGDVDPNSLEEFKPGWMSYFFSAYPRPYLDVPAVIWVCTCCVLEHVFV